MNRWIVLCLMLALLPLQTFGADPKLFKEFSYNLSNDATVELPGRLYVPAGIAEGEKRPLVLFLHGPRERGTDNLKQVNSNIDGLFDMAQQRGFFLYAPQLPETLSAWDNMYLDMAVRMVAQASKQYAVDISRMYVTGISLGGGGAKTLITNYRDNFAAAIIVSATKVSTADPVTLVGKPLWIMHAGDDKLNPDGGPAVPVEVSRDFVNEIRTQSGRAAWAFPAKYGGGAPFYPYIYITTPAEGSVSKTIRANYYNDNNLRYTEHAIGAHTATYWRRMYRESWLMDWMLAQKNPQHQLQVNEKILFDFGTKALSETDSQGRTWNATVANQEKTPGVAIPFARMADGTRSGVSLIVTEKFAGSASNGQTSGSIYPAAVAEDLWTVSANDPGTILLDGLAPGGKYSISVFASDKSISGLTRYTIGKEYRDLSILGNTSGRAVFESVVADRLGQLSLRVSVPYGGSQGGIGALELTAISESSAIQNSTTGSR